jgi:hypothetical protein
LPTWRGRIYFARDLSAKLNLNEPLTALLQSLAMYALTTLNLDEAYRLYEDMAKYEARSGEGGEATAFHQLGVIELRRREFTLARFRWETFLDSAGSKPAYAAPAVAGNP